MFSEIFQFGFMVRGLEAGILVALVAPLIGVFLVLRRYSLIADTLSHVSLAGLAFGILIGFNPIVTALIATVVSSLGIERLRTARKIYGESALALFLSGSLALAVVILSLARGSNVNILNYLFGSIVTVTPTDVFIIGLLAAAVLATIVSFYKELIYATFDEEAARVSGIRTGLINAILIVLSAFTVSIAIPIVGVLLISALIVIPVVIALQLRKSFIKTILYAELISLFSVIAGILASFYLDISTGGTIVLIMLLIFGVVLLLKKR